MLCLWLIVTIAPTHQTARAQFVIPVTWDIGRYEGGFALMARPSAQAIAPGSTARYILSLFPSDLPHTVTLSVVAPSPSLTTTLSSGVVAPGSVVTLTVSHDGSSTGRDMWHTIPISGTGGGFARTTSARLLVGGARVYLPLTLK